jgi:SEC-C motif-containing protein
MKITICPCGSTKNYSSCCEIYHLAQKKAETPEQLMRSRYSAYVVGNIDFIAKTNEPSQQDNFDYEAAETWSKQAEWLGLEIISAQDNEVEFKAHFKIKDLVQVHHEVSLFRYDEGQKQWFYTDGKDIRQPLKNANKVGRNDPCHCGSGKKNKKCCG